MSVNANNLKLGRNYLDLSLEEVANKTKISQKSLENFEKGLAVPSYRQLGILDSVYCQNLFFFYGLDQKLNSFSANFRIRNINRDIFQRYEDYALRRELLLTKQKIKTFEIHSQDRLPSYSKADQLIKLIRSNISYGEQRVARNIFTYLLKEIEDLLPILVFQTTQYNKINKHIHGVCCNEVSVDAPAIIINKDQSINSKAFTLLHELCHALIHNKNDTHLFDQESRHEKICNDFASEILLPSSELKRVVSSVDDWRIEDIKAQSRSLNVSSTHLLTRLLKNKAIGKDLYDKYKKQMDNDYEQYGQQATSGFAPYPYRVRDKLGRNYMRAIFNAYDRRDLTHYGVLNALNIKAKNFQEIREVCYV